MAAEKLFETKIKKFFHSVGIYPAGMALNKMKIKSSGWYFKYWAGPYSKAGIPDIICCIDGRFIAVEVKSEDGKPSLLQERNVELITECGGIAYILYPKDFEQFKKDIAAILNN